MKNLITFLLLFWMTIPFQAQVKFSKSFSGVTTLMGSDAIVTSTAEYIITGSSWTTPFSNSEDVLVIKTDVNGDTIWCRSYDNGSFERGNSLIEAENGDVLLAGLTGSDVLAMRLTPSGDTIWTKVFEGLETEHAMEITGADSSGYLIAGSTFSSTHRKDFFAIKINQHGDTLWTRNYGEVDTFDDLYSAIRLKNTGYLLTGSRAEQITPSDIYVMKLDDFGNVAWSKTYGSNAGIDLGFGAIETFDGGFAIIGYNEDMSGNQDFCIVKLNNFGDTLWTKSYQVSTGFCTDYGRDIVETSDSCLVFSGYMDPCISGTALVKVNALGDVVWSRVYDHGDYEVNNTKLHATSDGGVMFTSQVFDYNTGYRDLQVVKTNRNGEAGCQDSIIHPIVYHPNIQIVDRNPIHSSNWTISSGVFNYVHPVINDTTWCFSCDSVVANFSYSVQGLQVFFNDQSMGNNTWLWDFGNGVTSTDASPTHQYGNNGSYEVCLTVENPICGVNQFCDTVHVGFGNVVDQESVVKVYPNPFSNQLRFQTSERIEEVQLYDVTGKMVMEKSKVDAINTEFLSKGTYFLRVSIGGKWSRVKLVKM